jgi:small conductance mechanosensitive channel
MLACTVLMAAGPAIAQENAGEPGYQEKAEALDREIRDNAAETRRLTERAAESEGDYARILSRRAEEAAAAALSAAHRLARLVIEREEAGEDPAPWRERAVELLSSIHESSRKYIDQLVNNPAFALDTDSSEMTPADLVALEAKREDLTNRLVAIYDALLVNLELSQKLDVEVAEQRAYLEGSLPAAAESLSVSLEDSLERVKRLNAQLGVLPEDADLAARLKIADGRVKWLAATLAHVVGQLDKLELDNSAYKEQLIAVTGSVTTDIFDIDVLKGLLGRWFGGVGDWFVENLPQLLFSLLLFVLVVWLAMVLSRITRRLVTEGLKRSNLGLSRLLKNMIISTAANLVLLLGILFGLAQIGISVGPLLAGLGIAGFIVGFALQDTLGNFAAGMMILLFRPYDVGDIVEAGGIFGKVSHMSLVNTTILTFDNQTLVMPNSKIWGDVIKNVTAQEKRRVDMTFGIGYSDDIPKAEKVLTEIVTSHDKILADPAPVVRLHTLNESSVDFIVRPWVNTSDYWDVYWDVTRAVKIRFDEEDITIPFPQRDIHLYRGEQEPLATVIPTTRPPGGIEQNPVGWRGSKASEVSDSDDQQTPD